jgi:hypothetical protein
MVEGRKFLWFMFERVFCVPDLFLRVQPGGVQIM